jgi:hypothetical protein
MIKIAIAIVAAMLLFGCNPPGQDEKPPSSSEQFQARGTGIRLRLPDDVLQFHFPESGWPDTPATCCLETAFRQFRIKVSEPPAYSACG